MTTQTEALKLARQLLWRYRHETPIGRQPHMICQEVDEAFERIDEALAHPEQEPVAIHQYQMGDGSWIDQAKHSYDYNKRYAPNATVRIVYTTPPQRKPLTDEQIAHATAPVFMGGKPSLTGIARAIEAAHGIKGDA